MTKDSLQARYNIRPHLEKLFRGHGLRRRIRGFSAGFFVLVIEPARIPDVNPPARSIPLLKKVMASLSKHPADVFCKLLVGIRSPRNRCERVVVAEYNKGEVRAYGS